jgi:hypothetical protein
MSRLISQEKCSSEGNEHNSKITTNKNVKD